MAAIRALVVGVSLLAFSSLAARAWAQGSDRCVPVGSRQACFQAFHEGMAGVEIGRRALVSENGVPKYIDLAGKTMASFVFRCGRIVMLDSHGLQGWPPKPVACSGNERPDGVPANAAPAAGAAS